ncbi:MAG: DUF935 domain-containing protein [Bacteroidetes bacterium]|nr:DUF935 domain-containing protein [Bacteroidota bacterium]MCL2302920.1 DUF935 domain-containing protein [Lentimicrobiaceae bacterium]
MSKQQTKGTQQIKDKSKLLVEIKQSADNLTKKDIRTWRNAWQAAARPGNPNRVALYDVYTDVMVDLHLTGCIGQRTGMVLKRSFKIVSKKDGKENPEITELFECPWFKEFLKHSLESIYFGYSLIQFNDISTNGAMHFESVELVPRKHVVPEFGVIIENIYDDPLRQGYNYLHGDLSKWCIGVGNRKDLGLLLNVAPQSLPKKNMLSYWDAFGEIFGMPIRVARTGSRDPQDRASIEKMMQLMGAAGWAVLPEGTEIEIKETTRGDAFNVYDKRIERANSEISKGVLLQTMTTDNGGSLAQSITHLEILKNLVEADADFIRDVINWKLMPLMEMHGFPVQGMRFDWDESVDWTPEQQLQIEQMILGSYDIDPKYFAEKYNIPVTGTKSPLLSLQDGFFV